MLSKFIDWLITSSANPSEYSLTIKGVLLQYSVYILYGLQTLGLPLTQTQYVNDVAFTVQLLGAVLTIFGLVRKLYFLFKTKPVQLAPSTPDSSLTTQG